MTIHFSDLINPYVLYEITHLAFPHLLINGMKYPCPETLLIFHIHIGKFINGYDRNENKIFSLSVPAQISHLVIFGNKITY